MKRSLTRTTWVPAIAALCCFLSLMPARAQEPVITGFQSTGTLAWDNASTATVAVVERNTDPPTSSWVSVYAERPTAPASSGPVAMPGSGAWFRVLAAGTALEPAGMVLVPGGTFLMGDSRGTGDADEQPVHEVTLDAFYFQRSESTNDEVRDALQWGYDHQHLAVSAALVQNASGTVQNLLDLGDPDCRITWDSTNEVFGIKAEKGPGYPCVEITWYGACAVANFRSEPEGLQPCYDFGDGVSPWTCDWSADGYRLPTEAEWEKAARGGRPGLNFGWGGADTISHTWANFYSLWTTNGSPAFAYDVSPQPGYHPGYATAPLPYASPAGTFAANPFGAFDTAGNVVEWCWDTYDAGYYASSPGVNPRGPAWGDLKVGRGGSWNHSAAGCRAAARGASSADGSSSFAGFRLVRRVP